ncbi:dipeptidase [Tahibacter soli]|uniref:Dipeptidase n=1 Tax=Tahibacter soli TaxID=2983605 RepID=A0A9X4BHF2_9GAMM|nr:dipeptidase [Tahibacter soli]MDC8012328.1 dipeptidase [Tahibacter soli]
MSDSIFAGRRHFLAATAALTAAAALPAVAAAARTTRAWRGYRDAIVVDTLSGGPSNADATEPYATLDARALGEARASGMTACNVTVSGVGSYANDYAETIRAIAYWNGEIAAHPEHLSLVRRAADLADAKKTGRLGLIYGFQDATPFGDDAKRLDEFWGLGVRVFQLTYNRRNLVGDGCLEPGNAGLSTFGLELVEKINAKRGLVDLSHSGQRTALEAIAASKAPVVISHTACAALVARPRNKTDEELKAVADKGGVVGIYLMPFLRLEGQPMAQDLIRHIEHAVKVCGEDHVAIGTDGVLPAVETTPAYQKMFKEFVAQRIARGIAAPGESVDVYNFVPDLNTPDRLDTLAAMLSQRGHADARIAKIVGGNFARVFGEVCG